MAAGKARARAAAAEASTMDNFIKKANGRSGECNVDDFAIVFNTFSKLSDKHKDELKKCIEGVRNPTKTKLFDRFKAREEVKQAMKGMLSEGEKKRFINSLIEFMVREKIVKLSNLAEARAGIARGATMVRSLIPSRGSAAVAPASGGVPAAGGGSRRRTHRRARYRNKRNKRNKYTRK